MSESMRGEFDRLWDKSRPLDDCIQIYKGAYDNHRRARETCQKSPQRQDSLKPNSMQVSFMENLKDLLTKGEKGRSSYPPPVRERLMRRLLRFAA